MGGAVDVERRDEVGLAVRPLATRGGALVRVRVRVGVGVGVEVWAGVRVRVRVRIRVRRANPTPNPARRLRVGEHRGDHRLERTRIRR